METQNRNQLSNLIFLVKNKCHSVNSTVVSTLLTPLGFIFNGLNLHPLLKKKIKQEMVTTSVSGDLFFFFFFSTDKFFSTEMVVLVEGCILGIIWTYD